MQRRYCLHPSPTISLSVSNPRNPCVQSGNKRITHKEHVREKRITNLKMERELIKSQFLEMQELILTQQSKVQSLEREQLAIQHRKDEKDLRKQHKSELSYHPKVVKTVRAKINKEKFETLKRKKLELEMFQRQLTDTVPKDERRRMLEEAKTEFQRTAEVTEREFDQMVCALDACLCV